MNSAAIPLLLMLASGYDYIEENSDNPIIALGSSKMRENLNGQYLIEEFIDEGEFFNLAYAGERPYVPND